MTNVYRLCKSQPKKEKKMDSGFIPLFRNIQEQPWYKHSEYKAVFIHLLINASHKPCEVSFRGCDINLLPGQLATSYKQLESALNLSKSIIQRALNKFKSLGQISALNFNKNGHKYTVITISSWSDFHKKIDTVNDTASDTVKPLNLKGLNSGSDTVNDTVIDTQNNKTISTNVDIVRSCPEQSSGPKEELTNIFLPLNKKDTNHYVSVNDFNEYQELYPSVDIHRQFRLMFTWLRDNPKRKKTKAGVRRFITSWLSREQDRPKDFKRGDKNELTDISWSEGFEVDV